jgi:antitoxin ChpS
MGVQSKLRKVGGSVMVAIPPALLEQLNLAPDAAVELSVKGGRLLVEQLARRRYSLKDLLAEARKVERKRDKDKAWVSGPRAGRELI